MANQTYKLAYQITADVQQALASLDRFKKASTGLTVGPNAMKSPFASWAYGRDFDTFKGKISAMGTSLKSHFSSLGTSLKTIFWSIPTGFISGLGIARNMIAGLIGMARNVAFTALKWGGIGLGAAYAANKIMTPAATDETRVVRLRANQMDEGMLSYFRKFALNNSQQSVDSLMSAGITLKNQGLDPKKYLQILSDASVATGRSLEDLTHTIAVIKSGNVMGVFRQLSDLGISRNDMSKQGIKFEQTPMGEYEIKSDAANREKVFNSIVATLSHRYGGTSVQMSDTLTDKISDLKDQLVFTLSDLTKQFLPAAKAIVDSMTVVAKAFGSEEGRENIISAFRQSWNIFAEGILGIISDLISSLINVTVKIIKMIVGWFVSGEAWATFKKLGGAVAEGIKVAIVGNKRTFADVSSELREKESALKEGKATYKGFFGETHYTDLTEDDRIRTQKEINALKAEQYSMISGPAKYQPNISSEGILVTTHIKQIASSVKDVFAGTITKEKERQTQFDEMSEYFGKNRFTDVNNDLNKITSTRIGMINGQYESGANINDALLAFRMFKSDYSKLDKYNQNAFDQGMTPFQKSYIARLEKIAKAIEDMTKINKIMAPKSFSQLPAPDFTY